MMVHRHHLFCIRQAWGDKPEDFQLANHFEFLDFGVRLLLKFARILNKRYADS